MRIDLSDQSIGALAQVLTGGASGAIESVGVYRQGWKLKALFEGYLLDYDMNGPSRVSETVRVLTVASARTDDTIERLLLKSVDPRDYVDHDDWHQEALDYLNGRLAFDGLKLERSGIKVRLVSTTGTGAVVHALGAAIELLDLDTVHRDLERALASAEADPEDAVTAACSVVESVCRSILDASGLEWPAKEDVSGLYKAVRDPLGLNPTKDGVPDEIAADVRDALSGLTTAVKGIGALRTHGGDAHGRERGFKRIDPRIARLAIHSASAVALFLLETWQLRFPEKALPRRR